MLLKLTDAALVQARSTLCVLRLLTALLWLYEGSMTHALLLTASYCFLLLLTVAGTKLLLTELLTASYGFLLLLTASYEARSASHWPTINALLT